MLMNRDQRVGQTQQACRGDWAASVFHRHRAISRHGESGQARLPATVVGEQFAVVFPINIDHFPANITNLPSQVDAEWVMATLDRDRLFVEQLASDNLLFSHQGGIIVDTPQ